MKMVAAYMNHGRWVIDCPACNTGWLVRPETPSLLVDGRGGVHHGCKCGDVLIVQFPAEKMAIEEQVEKRPNLINRNWRAGETIADLRLENAAYLTGATG